MSISQGQQESVSTFQNIAAKLAQKLPKKTLPIFLSVILGVLLSIARRRTVTAWLQAAQMSDDYQKVFYHMHHVGVNSTKLFEEMLDEILQRLRPTIETASSIRIVFDDSPTKRYGSHIEGAGTHHNPTPGKTDAKFCYGHSWVVAALVITHPSFGEITLPIACELYLRQKEIDKLQGKYKRTFQTKTVMVVKMVERLVPKFKAFDKRIEVIFDGGYSNATVMVPLKELGNVVVITRLRRDAAVYTVPPTPEKPKRGRPKVYGDKINMKAMIDSEEGWSSIECQLYGKKVTKQIKSFIASTRLTKGKPVKIVLIKEEDGIWVPLLSTDVMMSDKEILESYGVRFGIEETFKDLKEVWGWGKQEVRLLESNEAVTAMNMLSYNMVILSTWDRKAEELVDRQTRPWDDADRRPSHADRRNFLRFAFLLDELNASVGPNFMPKKFKDILKRLLNLAS